MNSYILEGQKGFTKEFFIKGLKSKYKSFGKFKEDNDRFTGLTEQDWYLFSELTLEECLAETNIEKRRVLFSCLGPENLVNIPGTKIIDRQVINRTNKKLVGDKVLMYELTEEYTLYSIKGTKLGLSIWEGDCKVVKCVCPTDGKVYFLFVEHTHTDAIEAIASTFRLIADTEENIDKIYRQGDVILYTLKKDPKYKTWVTLSKQGYLNKIEWQS